MNKDGTISFQLWWGLLGCAAFMVAILLAAPYSNDIVFLPDQGGAWYFWKLPDPTAITRLVAWGSYTAHQLAIWWLIYLAKSQQLKYTSGLHPVNRWALGINALFIAWHIIQTRIWYDGLAQDVSIWSSMGSVVLMLLLVIIMENQRRGVVLGKKVSWFSEAGRFLRKYHGYYFSWAVIYTFWYHPIEITLGHLLGTFYVIMLLLQGSLFFTRTHLNRYWTGWLEVFVLFHGTMVAWLSVEDQSWQRFLFGFAAIFIITQMHGLGWSTRARWVTFAGFMAVLLAYYRLDMLAALGQTWRVPMIYLVCVPLLALIITAALKGVRSLLGQ